MTYVILSPNVTLRLLEEPCLFNRSNDELYELDRKSFEFMSACLRGNVSMDQLNLEEKEFIDYCLGERLVCFSETVPHRDITVGASPTPSLRYIELKITEKCNLRCKHCYMGESGEGDLSKEDVANILAQFEKMQGLTVLISGGEPLSHPHFEAINDYLDRFELRFVLLTNGTQVSKDMAKDLKVHEVQLSLDGLKRGHDFLRGTGAFDKTVKGIEYLIEAGVEVSIATMIYKRNYSEIEQMKPLLAGWGIKVWNLDLPISTGRWSNERGLDLDLDQAATVLDNSYGGGRHYHTSEGPWACGAHFATVLPDGRMVKCGLYKKSGTAIPVIDNLKEVWVDYPHIILKNLKCDCNLLDTCRGGCRYRAGQFGDDLGPDLLQCHRLGVSCRTNYYSGN